MKILAGRLKNQTIDNVSSTSRKNELRPSEAVVKKSLFETLKPGFYDCSFLDLFSGTGAVGIEAFSRGASFVGFVEINKNFYLALLKKIKAFSIPSLLLLGNCFYKLKVFKKREITFDYIFLDPPYKFAEYQKIITQIINLSILKKNGIIVVERHYKSKFLSNDFLLTFAIEIIKEKKIGSTVLSYIKEIDHEKDSSS